jgi:FtsP/CotA-like multicopper oxidase with cupredoxin domain
VSVADLTGPDGPPDVRVTLTARAEAYALASGERVKGYTVNGTSPGPALTVRQGDLVEVTLVNESVEDGTTLHWHGVDVPAAEDGVAGVTQDAVPVGGSHIYRFVAADPGTYWYHSHQVADPQVRGGLFGTLVVLPRDAAAAAVDVVAPVHTYAGRRTVAGRTGEQRVDVPAGAAARVRLVGTDGGPVLAWVSGGPYRVLAVDGTDVVGPTRVEDRRVVVPAGGRVDLEVVPGADEAVRVDVGGGAALVLGPPGARTPAAEELPDAALELLTYGSSAPTGIDPDDADRHFDYRIGRRPGLLDGVPGLYWTVNGRMWPDVPMFVVDEGDLVTMTIRNDSGDVHPMHLHGHHVLVLSRNGTAASGSPWWTDSLQVDEGDAYVVAFRADNPGVWTDHCHNLPHASEGLVTHLAYSGVTVPFSVGGAAANAPE